MKKRKKKPSKSDGVLFQTGVRNKDPDSLDILGRVWLHYDYESDKRADMKAKYLSKTHNKNIKFPLLMDF